MRFKPTPGMICSVDPSNILKQDTTGITIVSIVKRRKYKPFGNSLWEVRNLDPDNSVDTFVCQEKLLAPTNMCVNRVPTDIPLITQSDIAILETAITGLSNIYNTQTLNKIRALKEKLEFYKSMREV